MTSVSSNCVGLVIGDDEDTGVAAVPATAIDGFVVDVVLGEGLEAEAILWSKRSIWLVEVDALPDVVDMATEVTPYDDGVGAVSVKTVELTMEVYAA